MIVSFVYIASNNSVCVDSYGHLATFDFCDTFIATGKQYLLV